MNRPRSGEEVEYVQGTRWSGEALGQFIFTNMPPEAEQAIDDRVVTPTTTEFVRLAGIEIDDLPPLTIADLIGPTSIGELDERDQAFYFSGPNHPVLVRARRLPTFVTYRNILDVHGDLGIRRETATKNFKGLIRSIFDDEEISTYGEPRWRHFERKDAGGVPMLHRFAVRRGLAQMAMTGEYRVSPGDQTHTNIFNGYGRALIRALYDPGESMQRMEVTMELEALSDLIVDKDDVRCFQWGKAYHDADGVGHKMNRHDQQGAVHGYIIDLLTEIGAIDPSDWWPKATISEEGFAVAANALCPLGSSHTRTIKAGHTCTGGVHRQGLTRGAVQKAQSIAACITEASESERSDDHEEELNLEDPGLEEMSVQRRAINDTDFQW